MVMHARKLPRISDGFTEKHQPHGYENAKYTGKYRYGSHEKGRDSPSSNSIRSSSPDSRSQSPRYHRTSYYKVREKDRREGRDSRVYRNREGSRSPKDRPVRREVRDREERDHRDYRTTHERMNSVHKKDESKERLMRVGDWSEHVSSSGKKYYYNCRTEVSQWEKPSEWLEWERNHRLTSLGIGPNQTTKEVPTGVHRSQNETSRQDKHSSLGDSYQEGRELTSEHIERERRESYRNDDHFERRESRKYVQDVGTTDMEISSGDSTPTYESQHLRLERRESNQDRSQSLHSVVSSTLLHNHPSTSAASLQGCPSRTKLTISNLGPLPASQLSNLPGTGSDMAGIPSGSNSLVNSSTTQLNSQSHLGSLSGHGSLDIKGGIGPPVHDDGGGTSGSSSNKPHLEPLSISTVNSIGGGPPTPTHSENHDGIDVRKLGSPSSSLNSLQSLSQSTGSSLAAVKQSIPALTPSLANFYNEALIAHGQGWPAEAIEKQCQRLSEEAHTLGSLIMTKVSAELKMARSLVRLAEIQGTLHEQRILFLRAQKKELEEMKSHNSFMNDT